VDVEPALKRRLKVAAALRNVTVKDLIEQALERELGDSVPDRAARDLRWLEGDVSQLGLHDPYQWEEEELDEGEPLTPEYPRA